MTTVVSEVKPVTLTAGRLPSWTTGIVLTVALLASATLFFATGSPGFIRILLVGALVFTAVMVVLSLIVEGSRKAKDRLSAIVVTSAFVLALLPLVSLVISVIQKGIARFDLQFFTYSMRNVVGEGGGAVHAIIGTLWVTGIATLISVPIGLLAAIYLVEYGERPAGPLHHLLRRRDDRHPVDRGRPVRVLAVRADLRTRHQVRHRRRGRPVRADDPGRGALHRGAAQDRPERVARSGVRARRAEVADHRQGRAADRAGRHRDRRDAGRGPGDR